MSGAVSASMRQKGGVNAETVVGLAGGQARQSACDCRALQRLDHAIMLTWVSVEAGRKRDLQAMFLDGWGKGSETLGRWRGSKNMCWSGLAAESASRNCQCDDYCAWINVVGSFVPFDAAAQERVRESYRERRDKRQVRMRQTGTRPDRAFAHFPLLPSLLSFLPFSFLLTLGFVFSAISASTSVGIPHQFLLSTSSICC